jgi:hypothetical protein
MATVGLIVVLLLGTAVAFVVDPVKRIGKRKR